MAFASPVLPLTRIAVASASFVVLALDVRDRSGVDAVAHLDQAAPQVVQQRVRMRLREPFSTPNCLEQVQKQLEL